jgi:SOS-response transcriptional repressor LexA
MEPRIPDGSYCLFRSPVEGARQGKIVLVQLRDSLDPESGERFTVKRYYSEKVETEESWRHLRIELHPENPDYDVIQLGAEQSEQLRVLAELLEVL